MVEPIRFPLEVVRHIIAFSPDPFTCAQCAQLNHQWNEEATRVLWEGDTDQNSPWRTPNIHYLSRLVSNPARFQYYMSRIRHLILGFGFNIPNHDSIASLWYEILRSDLKAATIIIDLGSDNMLQRHILPLLQPELKKLELFGGSYNERLFECLADRAPSLCSLLIDLAAPLDKPQALAIYLSQRNSSLKSLQLGMNTENLLTREAWNQLSVQDQLIELALQKTVLASVDTDAFPQMLLPKLTTFSTLATDCRTLGKIISYSYDLQSAIICIQEPIIAQTDLLPQMQHLRRLSKLELSLPSSAQTTPSLIPLLCNQFPALGTLDIATNEHDDPPSTGLWELDISALPVPATLTFDGDFGIDSSMIHLRFLAYRASTFKLSGLGLCSFAAAFPVLEQLCLSADLDLRSIAASPPLIRLPFLRTLEIRMLIIDDERRLRSHNKLVAGHARDIASALTLRMPQLRTMSWRHTFPMQSVTSGLIKAVNSALRSNISIKSPSTNAD